MRHLFKVGLAKPCNSYADKSYYVVAGDYIEAVRKALNFHEVECLEKGDILNEDGDLINKEENRRLVLKNVEQVSTNNLLI